VPLSAASESSRTSRSARWPSSPACPIPISASSRGRHPPSVLVLKLISGALGVSTEMLLAQTSVLDPHPADAAKADAQQPPESTETLASIPGERIKSRLRFPLCR